MRESSTVQRTQGEDSFWDVVGDSIARINNYLDGEKSVPPGEVIVARARSQLGTRGYDLVSKNCEHFVTWCRYGEERSQQVKEESFWEVVGDSKAEIYNDKKQAALPRKDVVANARSKLGNVGYHVLVKNCEHFATWCRYGEGFSKQADNFVKGLWVAGFVTTFCMLFLLAVASLDLVAMGREACVKIKSLKSMSTPVGFSHWGVYAGDGRVIHRTEDTSGGCRVKIREDSFWDVAGRSWVKINNYLDNVKTALPGSQVVQRARSKLGNTGYTVLFRNCEHFATWCRYGFAFSGQVLTAGSISAGLTVAGVATANPILFVAGVSLGSLMALMNAGSNLFIST
ncbi:hypothetical protein Bbelb_122090 [Branchiostoma belcheri]|nr:hypothetical protein Bbelb_122090 [Branchiostoma belcheri]